MNLIPPIATRAARREINARSLRMWAGIHRWTSIISTLFLLILSITGLPLIFQAEIDEAFGSSATSIEAPTNAKAPSLDAIVAATLARRPGEKIISLEFAKHWPIAEIRSAPSLEAEPGESHRDTIDLRTGQLTSPPPRRGPVMQFLHALHADLFLGLPGGLFLAGIALIVIASVISGLVLYPPFVRRFGFGTVRIDKSRRVLWLDLHNLTGIITVAWLLLVAITGAINTLHGPVSASVRDDMSDDMRTHALSVQTEPSGDGGRPWSIDATLAASRDRLPTARALAVYFPGTTISPPDHYAVIAKSMQMMTQELFYAVLIDARTGTVSEVFKPRGIAKAMLLAEPWHFPTTFPGLLPKAIWAFFDVVTIIVLSSGLYLWIGKFNGHGRRKRPSPRSGRASPATP